MDITGDLNITQDREFKLCVPAEGQEIFKKYPELEEGKFLTLTRSVDTNNTYQGSTRLWPVESYEKFIKLFKQTYPDYKIVYLGPNRKVCVDLKGIELNLVGKTSFSELLAILDRSTLHFDMECGMVHLRHFLGRKPSIVLFGPTSPKLKGHKENLNIQMEGVCSLPFCEHIILNGDWARSCLQKDSCEAACMKAISPEKVLKELHNSSII